NLHNVGSEDLVSSVSEASFARLIQRGEVSLQVEGVNDVPSVLDKIPVALFASPQGLLGPFTLVELQTQPFVRFGQLGCSFRYLRLQCVVDRSQQSFRS